MILKRLLLNFGTMHGHDYIGILFICIHPSLAHRLTLKEIKNYIYLSIKDGRILYLS